MSNYGREMFRLCIPNEHGGAYGAMEIQFGPSVFRELSDKSIGVHGVVLAINFEGPVNGSGENCMFCNVAGWNRSRRSSADSTPTISRRYHGWVPTFGFVLLLSLHWWESFRNNNYHVKLTWLQGQISRSPTGYVHTVSSAIDRRIPFSASWHSFSEWVAASWVCLAFLGSLQIVWPNSSA